MHNKVLVFEIHNYFDEYIEEKINKELYQGWLIKSYYETKGKLIVTFYREEKGWRPSTPEEWEELKGNAEDEIKGGVFNKKEIDSLLEALDPKNFKEEI